MAKRDVYLLATGTGIAPIQAILEAHALLPKELQAASLTLIWGGRVVSDFYLNFDTKYNVTFIPILSLACNSWPGAYGYGYVQDVLQR